MRRRSGSVSKRMMIIGSGGAGKSTLARKLGEKYGLKVYHLDALLWKSNWNQVPRDQQITIQKKIIQGQECIIDGNYCGTMDIRIEAADTIIFLDIPRIICIYRVLKRAIQYRNKTRPDMVEGNKEKIDIQFYRWIWNYPKDKRPMIIKRLKELEHEKKIIHLKSLREIRQFINE